MAHAIEWVKRVAIILVGLLIATAIAAVLRSQVIAGL
jgi:hypothetical protein